MNRDLVSDYPERAKEYEKVYFDPDKQDNLQMAEKVFKYSFAHFLFGNCVQNGLNESVIEINRQEDFLRKNF